MKRPEGFDPPAQTPPKSRQAARPKVRAEPKAQPQARVSAEPKVRPEPRAKKPPAPDAASKQGRPPRVRRDSEARAADRKLARERRQYEKAEVRRFTRRARNRRIIIAVIVGTVVTLLALVLTAVYSPILALRTITVDGTTRIDAAEVVDAVDGQLGTPLALIDFGKITTELGAFPLIRSYVTETVPPDKLIIHIVERQPVGSLKQGTKFTLVDPAGVTVQESPERIAGVPLIDLAGGDTTSPAFASVVEVLLALPASLLAQVDSISAHTQDDVTLVLTGVGQKVTWGSADNSERKAALLAALIAVTDPSLAGEFDVSAPSNGVFRPAG